MFVKLKTNLIFKLKSSLFLVLRVVVWSWLRSLRLTLQLLLGRWLLVLGCLLLFLPLHFWFWLLGGLLFFSGLHFFRGFFFLLFFLGCFLLLSSLKFFFLCFGWFILGLASFLFLFLAGSFLSDWKWFVPFFFGRRHNDLRNLLVGFVLFLIFGIGRSLFLGFGWCWLLRGWL